MMVNTEDKLIRAISAGGDVKIAAVTTRNIVERARNIHHTLPTVTAALGRTLSATSMMGAAIKQENGSVTVRINGGGPIGSVIAVSDSGGNVRGYAQNPGVDIPRRPDGKLAVGAGIGTNGLITVTKDTEFGDPYVGSSTLVSGEIAEDVARYYVESEQVPTACGLGVLVDRDQSVIAAVGYLVELLPGAEVAVIDRLEANIEKLGTVTDVLRAHPLETLVERVLDGFSPNILEEHPIAYRCGCTRERVITALKSTGEDNLRDMAESGEETEVTCQFCDVAHRFTPDEVGAMICSS